MSHVNCFHSFKSRRHTEKWYVKDVSRSILYHAKSIQGKQWNQPKTAFRPNAGLTSYAKRVQERKAMQVVKAKEKEMKDEKEEERQVSALQERDASLCQKEY